MGKLNTKIKVGIVSVFIVGMSSIAYWHYDSTHFDNNTFVYGVDISKKTPKDAYKLLEDNKPLIEVKEGENVVFANTVLSYTDFDQSTVDKYFESGEWEVKVDENSITKSIYREIENKDRTPSQNAKIENVDGDLKITEAVPGNQVDINQLSSEIIKVVKDGMSLDLDLGNFYLKPELTSDSKEMKAIENKMKKEMSLDISLKVGNETIPFAGEMIAKGVAQEGFNTKVLEDEVNAINDEHKTRGKEMEFTTHKGTKERFVNTIEYSWEINVPETLSAIKTQIESGESGVVEAVIDGQGMNDTVQFGGNYIEIDLNAQHAYIFRDGKQAMDWPIITGMPTPAQSTDPGIFEVLYKQRNTTLRGKNSDGSDYASPVDYWIPITWMGIGIHDSPWQPESQYGNPTAFSSIGSHGCINTSPSVMPKVWDLTYDKMPAIVWGTIYN